MPRGDQSSDPKHHRRVTLGLVTVTVSDEREFDEGSEVSGHEPLDLKRWGLLAASAVSSEGVRRAAELGLIFVNEAAMAELAAKWLQSDHSTDVLAFPLDKSARPARRGIEEQVPPLLMGDVVVCPVVAARQASEQGHRLADELALLIVHGVLHLLGHDHAGPLESLKMKRRTRAILACHYRSEQAHVSVPQPQGSGRTG